MLIVLGVVSIAVNQRQSKLISLEGMHSLSVNLFITPLVRCTAARHYAVCYPADHPEPDGLKDLVIGEMGR
jgi:hypothetical protein